jgi:hypothetical protein
VYNETVHQLFIDFKKAYDSVGREVLYNILIGFGVHMKLVRLIKMCLNETYSRREEKCVYNETVHQLFIGFKKAYDSVGGEVLYNILIWFGVHMKLVRLIKMCLNETYSKVCIGKH